MKICLIEDDLELGRALQGALHYDGHEVVWVRRLVDGEHRLQADLFRCCLLDLSLPDGWWAGFIVSSAGFRPQSHRRRT